MSANHGQSARLFAVAPNDSDRPTPQAFFDELNSEFSFTLDACATRDNAKCARFYTVEDDGLNQPWRGIVWCNPPYGRKIGLWIEKGLNEARGGACVVMLLPASTDTAWFHDYALRGEVRYIRGRLTFEGQKSPAPFGSIVVVFDGRKGQL